MLSIIFGDYRYFNEKYGTDYKVIQAINNWFDNNYTIDWLNNEFAKRAIKEVDKSFHIKDHYIESPFLGAIPPKLLSGGVKTIISMYNDEEDNIFDITNCGNNCSKLILEIGKMKDITVNLEYVMNFNGDENFEVKMLNNGKIYTNFEKFLADAVDYKFPGY